MNKFKIIFLVLVGAFFWQPGHAECCKTKKKDGSPDVCTNRAVTVIAPSASGACMSYGAFMKDNKIVQISADQTCPDCGHYIFDHNCEEKQKDDRGGGKSATQAKVIKLGKCQ